MDSDCSVIFDSSSNCSCSKLFDFCLLCKGGKCSQYLVFNSIICLFNDQSENAWAADPLYIYPANHCHNEQ